MRTVEDRGDGSSGLFHARDPFFRPQEPSPWIISGINEGRLREKCL